MIDVPKAAALSLVMTLAVPPSWQVTEAADGVRGRHSLIHRPQIQPAPALTPASSAPQPQLHSSSPSPSTPSQPIRRKVVRRPAAPLVEVAPMDPGNSAPTDPPPPDSQFYNPDDAPPELAIIPPRESPEAVNAEAR
ncbi:MAG: hypothetical protein JNN16_06945 [Nitrospira sp.]|nr:hypothetical protein [Nitrospira sp.]